MSRTNSPAFRQGAQPPEKLSRGSPKPGNAATAAKAGTATIGAPPLLPPSPSMPTAAQRPGIGSPISPAGSAGTELTEREKKWPMIVQFLQKEKEEGKKKVATTPGISGDLARGALKAAGKLASAIRSCTIPALNAGALAAVAVGACFPGRIFDESSSLCSPQSAPTEAPERGSHPWGLVRGAVKKHNQTQAELKAAAVDAEQGAGSKLAWLLCAEKAKTERAQNRAQMLATKLRILTEELKNEKGDAYKYREEAEMLRSQLSETEKLVVELKRQINDPRVAMELADLRERVKQQEKQLERELALAAAARRREDTVIFQQTPEAGPIEVISHSTPRSPAPSSTLLKSPMKNNTSMFDEDAHTELQDEVSRWKERKSKADAEAQRLRLRLTQLQSTERSLREQLEQCKESLARTSRQCEQLNAATEEQRSRAAQFGMDAQRAKLTAEEAKAEASKLAAELEQAQTEILVARKEAAAARAVANAANARADNPGAPKLPNIRREPAPPRIRTPEPRSPTAGIRSVATQTDPWQASIPPTQDKIGRQLEDIEKVAATLPAHKQQEIRKVMRRDKELRAEDAYIQECIAQVKEVAKRKAVHAPPAVVQRMMLFADEAQAKWEQRRTDILQLRLELLEPLLRLVDGAKRPPPQLDPFVAASYQSRNQDGFLSPQKKPTSPGIPPLPVPQEPSPPVQQPPASERLPAVDAPSRGRRGRHVRHRRQLSPAPAQSPRTSSPGVAPRDAVPVRPPLLSPVPPGQSGVVYALKRPAPQPPGVPLPFPWGPVTAQSGKA